MSPKFARRAIVAAIASLFLPAHAQDTRLAPVVVTAEPVEEAAQIRLSGDTLLAPAAASRDTTRLLTELPGFSVNPAGGISAFPAYHGLADDRLRLSVDGADLVASCPNHMNTPLSYVDPAQIREIRVYSGIAPVSAGGDSLGPVVQVETRGVEFAKAGERLAQGRVGFNWGSNASALGANAFALLANESFSVSYTGAASRADNYSAGAEFKTYDFTGRAGLTLPRDEVGSTAYKAQNHQLAFGWRGGEHRVEAKFAYQGVPHQLYPNQRMDMLDNTEHRASLRYLGAFAWGNLEAQLYHQRVEHYMDFGADKRFYYGSASGGGGAINPTACGPISPTCAWGMPMYTESTTTGGGVKTEVPLAAADLLRLGAEFQRYRLDDWWPPSGAMMWPGTFWNIRDGKRDRAGIYGEWERQVDARWKTVAGVRYENVRTDAGPVVGYDPTGGGTTYQQRDATAFNAQDRSRSFHNWDVSVIARFTPDATRDIEFGFARKTRAPSLYELYPWSTWSMAAVMNNFVGDGNGYVGNPGLKAEKAHTLSATFDWHAADRAWEFKATPYLSRVSDYIDAIQWNAATNAPAATNTTGQFVTLRYVNQTARLYGLDLSGRLPLASTSLGHWGLKGLFAYTRGKNLDTGDDLYNIMPLNVRLSLTHKHGGWDNALEVVGVRRKDSVSDVRNEIVTPGYALVNLRAAHRWKQARVDFGIENLFDRLYFLPTGGAYLGQGTTMSINPTTQPKWGTAVPGMGRNFYAAVTLDF